VFPPSFYLPLDEYGYEVCIEIVSTLTCVEKVYDLTKQT
jgi:hypothetical protein